MPLIQYLSRIQFDFGAIASLPEELERLGVARPLLVTDPGVAAAGHAERAAALLNGRPAARFDETPENPTEEAALAALALYRAHGCDGVVSLGGGSAIDLGKAVALLATHDGGLADYVIAGGGSERIGSVAPQIAIPTTAGTGAEVGRACTLTLASGRKAACVNLNLVPKVALCDPELTLSLPPRLTAATGMDALSHGIEAYLSNRENPPAGAIALDCVRRVAANIEAAVADGGDRKARREMLMGAVEGGLTLQKGLGAVHAMSHPLGELKLHHGTLNAVLLPIVLRFNAGHAAEKIGSLKAAAGLAPDADLAAWVRDLNARIGMPANLREMGVSADDIGWLAAAAAKDHLSVTNPRPADAADYRRLFEEALG